MVCWPGGGGGGELVAVMVAKRASKSNSDEWVSKKLELPQHTKQLSTKSMRSTRACSLPTTTRRRDGCATEPRDALKRKIGQL